MAIFSWGPVGGQVSLDGIGGRGQRARPGHVAQVLDVAGGEDGVVDDELLAVLEGHPLAPVIGGGEVYGGRRVVLDGEVGRGFGAQDLVEPLQVLPHDPPGEEVVRADRRAHGRDPALHPLPAVALVLHPLVEPPPELGVVQGLGEGVHGMLPAGSVEDQVVGLVERVHAPAGAPGLDDMHHDVGVGRPPGRVDKPLQGAQAPRAQADNADLSHGFSPKDS